MPAIMKQQHRGASALAPWRQLRDEMDGVLGDFFNNEWPLAFGTTAWPPLDLAETEDSLVLRAEVPGMKPEDIDISVQGNALVITGEKKQAQEETGREFYHSERRYGSFRRELNLVSTVDVDKIKAEYNNGVLTVTMPKSEKAKPKHISIKA